MSNSLRQKEKGLVKRLEKSTLSRGVRHRLTMALRRVRALMEEKSNVEVKQPS